MLENFNHSIIFFDGVCNLCNQFIDFTIKRDTKRQYRYASLQSGLGQQILDLYKFPKDNLKTIILIENGIMYQKSEAVLRVVSTFGGSYKLAHMLLKIPRAIRDTVYMLFSNNRYLIFGKKDSCRLPTAEERELFLE